ncbi:patatin-like phospholipase family protein [Nafulsella turpanensis]|uniref:patatin-like phospholipase family protein n=1 Tax=Nafulsella turpanensis TaxID=1265690 RepID=UPI000347E875|nr:patatin-like phospholipase family protein [Nafulsella turpanensis]
MKLGIALSGGGIRCIAHLGIIKGLQEEGVMAGEYTGSSAGALAAALLAAGKEPEEILELLLQTQIFSAIRPAFSFRGLLDVEKALSFCLPHLPETFEELKVPLVVAATQVRSGKTTFFSKGPLKAAVLASCCLPVIFHPVKVDGELYIDGGLINNLPVEPLKWSCDKVLGIHTNPVDEDFSQFHIKGLMERTFLLTINANVEQRKGLCDVFLEPDFLKKVKVFDFKKTEEIFTQSYAWIKEQMPVIMEELE